MAKTIDYLKTLATVPLPRTVPEGRELETLRFLRAAGWVDATMPKTGGEPAVVKRITFAGQAVLEQVRRYDMESQPAPRTDQRRMDNAGP